MFDAQSLSIAQIKQSVEQGDAAQSSESMVPAERLQRIREQRTRLAGFDLVGRTA